MIISVISRLSTTTNCSTEYSKHSVPVEIYVWYAQDEYVCMYVTHKNNGPN